MLCGAAGSRLMDRARQQFFARATLACDQHARVSAGDHVGLTESLFHDGAACDDLCAPVLVGGAKAGDPQRLLHMVEQFLLVDGFGEKAERAHLGGLHGVRDRAVRGEQNDLQARPAVLQLLQQPDAVHLIHAQIGDHQVGPEAAGSRERERRALHGLDVVTLGAQADRQQAQQPWVIVHYQNACFAFACLTQGLMSFRTGFAIAQ